eukprot:GHVT01032333.1.p1 GENE.GHVT01032333.1~~GHVT01032333.1.p1  ORF type:complete len:563 (-),score=115.57 GHVT01032333.1:865-2553(-)
MKPLTAMLVQDAEHLPLPSASPPARLFVFHADGQADELYPLRRLCRSIGAQACAGVSIPWASREELLRLAGDAAAPSTTVAACEPLVDPRTNKLEEAQAVALTTFQPNEFHGHYRHPTTDFLNRRHFVIHREVDEAAMTATRTRHEEYIRWEADHFPSTLHLVLDSDNEVDEEKPPSPSNAPPSPWANNLIDATQVVRDALILRQSEKLASRRRKQIQEPKLTASLLEGPQAKAEEPAEVAGRPRALVPGGSAAPSSEAIDDGSGEEANRMPFFDLTAATMRGTEPEGNGKPWKAKEDNCLPLEASPRRRDQSEKKELAAAVSETSPILPSPTRRRQGSAEPLQIAALLSTPSEQRPSIAAASPVAPKIQAAGDSLTAISTPVVTPAFPSGGSQPHSDRFEPPAAHPSPTSAANAAARNRSPTSALISPPISTPPPISISPLSVDFGTVTVGRRLTSMVRVRNTSVSTCRVACRIVPSEETTGRRSDRGLDQQVTASLAKTGPLSPGLTVAVRVELVANRKGDILKTLEVRHPEYTVMIPLMAAVVETESFASSNNNSNNQA